MKKQLNIIIILMVNIISVFNMYSQCPIVFPVNSSNGSKICLEGTPAPSNDICLENLDGDLKFILNGNNQNSDLFTFLKNGSLQIGDKTDNSFSSLIIKGANKPLNKNGKRDISFDFEDAGKSKIRAYRGGGSDTYLQFLTNPANSNDIENPIVRMHINENGKVGIGTEEPMEILDVKGNFRINSLNNNNYSKWSINNNNDLLIDNSVGKKMILQGPNQPLGIGSIRYLAFDFKDAGTAMLGAYRGGSMGTYLQFYTNDEGTTDNPLPRMQINSDGKVIIGMDTRTGISSPGNYRLYVADGVLSEKFKAAIKTTSQWSDYVFDDTYELKPLEEVEEFIKVNKHLPNIPSAEQLVKDGGIDLSEMQAKQMEKIEELTLYLIAMKKEIELLKKENKELKESR